jgi:hypothetical protein
MPSFITKAAVNNAILDPLQGFDCDVYIQDQATGKQLVIGRFTNFQFTVRNTTEPYMEFNQRVPRLLDGEFQFGWVLERGLIDVRFLEDTFGMVSLSREMRISRSPRFQITVELNAPELENPKEGSADQSSQELQTTSAVTNRVTRKASGKYRLIYAKTDSFTFGAMAGRNVIATRWEGLCEGLYYSNQADIWPGVNLGPGVGVNSNGEKKVITDVELKDQPGSKKAPTWDVFGAQTGDVAIVNNSNLGQEGNTFG